MKNIDVQPIRNKKQLKNFLELLKTSSNMENETVYYLK